MSRRKDEVSAKLDGLSRDTLVDVLNFLIGYVGPGRVDDAIEGIAKAYRHQRADLSPWCGPGCRPFATPPEHSSADHSARSGERAGSRRDV